MVRLESPIPISEQAPTYTLDCVAIGIGSCHITVINTLVCVQNVLFFLISIDRQSCYMVRADELYNEVTHDASGKGASQGMFVGCFVDTATGWITYTCEGKETSRRFKVDISL